MNLSQVELVFKKIIKNEPIKSVADKECSLKFIEFIHYYTYAKRNSRMARAFIRYNKSNNKKPISQINEEINSSRKYWRCYPLHYFRYNLYEKDNQLSNDELINFIPEFFFYYLYLPNFYPNILMSYLDDKNTLDLIFRKLFIAHPQVIFKLIKGQFFSKNMNKIKYYNIMNSINKNKYEKIFVKPSKGEGGYGIYIFHRLKNGKYKTNNNIIFNKEFLKRISNKDYIIQPGIMQDESISRIYDKSVNTFRILTKNQNGKAKILCATLRFGRNGKELDNGTQDGVLVKVNINNGILGNYAKSEECEQFERHPDTNFKFKNYQIKRWDEIKKFTIEAAQKLSDFTYLGWDIALTRDRPIAIETNYKFGLDHYQIALGGLREILDIRNPDFYWKNKGKLN